MPEFSTFEIATSVVEVRITDLPAILSRMHRNWVPLSVPVVMEGQKNLAKVDYKLGEVYLADWAEPDTPHEIQRTAVELLVITEIYRRLGFLLAESYQEFAKKGPRLSDPFAFDKESGAIKIHEGYIAELFDLSKAKDIPSNSFAEFEVIDVRFGSPTSARAKIRKLVTSLPLSILLTVSPGPAFPPPFNIPATIEAIGATVGTVTGGIEIFHYFGLDGREKRELEDHNLGVLSSELQHHNGIALQNGLFRLHDRTAVPYYFGSLDGKIGHDTRQAVQRFAVEHGLPPYTDINDPLLLTAIAHALAEQGIKLS